MAAAVSPCNTLSPSSWHGRSAAGPAPSSAPAVVLPRQPSAWPRHWSLLHLPSTVDPGAKRHPCPPCASVHNQRGDTGQPSSRSWEAAWSEGQPQPPIISGKEAWSAPSGTSALGQAIKEASDFDQLLGTLMHHHNMLLQQQRPKAGSSGDSSQGYIGDLDAVNLSALATRLVKLCRSSRGADSALQPLLDLAVATLPCLRPRQLSSILWAAAKLGEVVTHGPSGPGSPQNARLPSTSSSSSTTQLPARAAAVSARIRGPFLQLAARMWEGHMLGKASAFDLVQTLYAHALMGYPLQPHQQEAVLEALQGAFQDFKPQDWSMLVYAMGLLRLKPGSTWLAAMADALAPALAQMAPQGLSNTAYGLACISYQPPAGFIRSLLDTSARLMGSMTDQELATLCWAMPYLLGTDMPRPSAWLAHLEAHATARMASMQPQHVGHVLWAMAKLQHKPGASLLVAVCREVPLKLSAGSPGGPPYQQQQQQQGRSRPAQGPGRSIGGYTRTQGAASQQAGEEPGAQPARTWVVSPQALCTILWSIARMGVLVSPSLLESLVAALGARLHACNAFDLSSALYALALLGYRPDTKWMARFLQECRPKLRTFSPPQLAALLLGLSKLRLRPEPAWLDWALLELGDKLGSCGPQELANSLWALGTLGYRPPPPWLAAFATVARPLLPAFSAQELWMASCALSKLGCRVGLGNSPGSSSRSAGSGVRGYQGPAGSPGSKVPQRAGGQQALMAGAQESFVASAASPALGPGELPEWLLSAMHSAVASRAAEFRPHQLYASLKALSQMRASLLLGARPGGLAVLPAPSSTGTGKVPSLLPAGSTGSGQAGAGSTGAATGGRGYGYVTPPPDGEDAANGQAEQGAEQGLRVEEDWRGAVLAEVYSVTSLCLLAPKWVVGQRLAALGWGGMGGQGAVSGGGGGSQGAGNADSRVLDAL